MSKPVILPKEWDFMDGRTPTLRAIHSYLAIRFHDRLNVPEDIFSEDMEKLTKIFFLMKDYENMNPKQKVDANKKLISILNSI